MSTNSTPIIYIVTAKEIVVNSENQILTESTNYFGSFLQSQLDLAELEFASNSKKLYT